MDETPFPPPPPEAARTTTAPPIAPPRFPDPVVLFLAAAGIGVLAGALIGTTVGFVVGAGMNADCSPQDGWCELGGAIFGFLSGAVTAVAAYLTAGIITIRRCRPPGARAPHITAHVAALIVLPALFTTLTSII